MVAPLSGHTASEVGDQPDCAPHSAPRPPRPTSERVIIKAVVRRGDTRDAPPDVRGSTDIVRAAIVCEDFASMVKLVALVAPHLLFAKDRYTDATDGGWSDVLLLLRVKGAIVELQVIHKRMRCGWAAGEGETSPWRYMRAEGEVACSLPCGRSVAVQSAVGVRRARGVQLRARRWRVDGVWGVVVAGAEVRTAVAGDGRGVV